MRSQQKKTKIGQGRLYNVHIHPESMIGVLWKAVDCQTKEWAAVVNTNNAVNVIEFRACHNKIQPQNPTLRPSISIRKEKSSQTCWLKTQSLFIETADVFV